ncbi:DUF389 domain-containing protein [Nocardiopsis sp. CNT312]|uniref:DUF389 domain-containing protein n=1 Tax=Nocardiopsis sp. CNT312 TaxID=1137268 RepID=UPI0004914A39|nr:DUF389 domain-containing protein [Nocardiopsis sp. CNT312]
MLSAILERVVPESQRRTVDELAEDLDLSVGDARAKRSSFWTMLLLSSVIAAAGVITDATATVIGAMIIAPLSTPIMGMALGSLQRRGTGSFKVVVLGCLMVIGVGTVMSLSLPQSYDLLSNSQISGRTSPRLMDLLAAIATGFAGAVALARRDVAAVLPGVAIAISLVPPLIVVGVCLEHGALWPALGALVLFLSNFFGLATAGMVVFAFVGYGPGGARRNTARRTRAVLVLLFIAVFIPMAVNTTTTFLIASWSGHAKKAAEQWLSETPGASVSDVDMVSKTMYIDVRTPDDLPSTDDLLTALNGRVPSGVHVVVESDHGEVVEAGTVGG